MSADLQVLLVEDSTLLSDRVLEMLSAIDGVETVGLVATESAAIQAVSDLSPDVIVLDLRLKEGTGFGVMRAINDAHKTHHPVIVVMTNFNLPQYRQQAMQLGAKYFLDKTHEFDQLPGIIATLRDRSNT